ncbi:MAG: hypothetical protein AAGE01_17750, partial [Pseudomonadota bacterium]
MRRLLLACLLLPAVSDAAASLDVDQQVGEVLLSKGTGVDLSADSIILRAAEGDEDRAPITHNVRPGDLLRPQLNYRASGGPIAHRVRMTLNGEVICEVDVETADGTVFATCPAVPFPEGKATIEATLDAADAVAENNENNNTRTRTFDTRVDDPLDLAAERIALVDGDGTPVDDPQPGDRLFLQFTFDVDQSVNHYWRAELRVDGERFCGFRFVSVDPGGSRRTVSCSQPIDVGEAPFTISGVADYRFEQMETDEGNNEAIARIRPGNNELPNVRVDRLQLPFQCCTPPPPDTRLGAVITSEGGLTAIGEPFAGDGRIVAFSEFEGFVGFEDFIFVPTGFFAANFGSAVAIEGDLMVVGAPVLDPADLQAKGGMPQLKAALFERLDGQWNLKQVIDPGTDQADDQFGFAIDLTGDTVLIGAPSDADGEADGEGSGAVYVYAIDGANNVVLREKLKPPVPMPGGGFGAAIAASDNRVAVASPATALGGAVAGSATLYERVAANLNPTGTVNGVAGDGFGTAIDLVGATMVVGAPSAPGTSTGEGAVHVFEVAPSGLEQRGVLTAASPVEGGGFGSAVATDGTFVTVGAPGDAGEVAGTSGAIYRFSGLNPLFRIPAPAPISDQPAFEGFGAAIDLAGRDLAIGAPGTDDARGAAALATGLPDGSFSGPWFSLGQAGHGWFIEQLEGQQASAPNRINAYWYVYRDGVPVWLTGQGPLSAGSATLDMFITSGPDFPPDFDSSAVDLVPWGTLTFAFNGDGGEASWVSTVAGFSSGSLPIQRIAPIAGARDACVSGSYFNRTQNGHGFVMQVFEIEGELEILVTWYVYLDGEQVWLLGQAPLRDDAATVPM